jgi:hypothetical protein
MAEKKNRQYDSIIDAILDEREPEWKDLGLGEAHASGEEQKDRTHQYVDKDFTDDIAESASRHTPVPPSKSAAHTYEERIAEKEAAAPRIHSVTAYRRMDEYKAKEGDNQSLMDEVTESVEKAYSNNNLAENSAAKKEVSDAQVFKYIRDLLNQGNSPAKVAAQLQKLAEIELFNHQSATDYLQRNAGLMGLAYLEPNTYMDKSSPTYEHTASSNDCVQQKRAWDKAGIKPQAHSVKQVSACQDCSYFKRNGSDKTCTLYRLPIVANEKELSQIVNHLTPGVPNNRKHAALVQIANGDGKRAQTATQLLAQTELIKAADAKVSNQSKRASYEYGDVREQNKHFSSEHVAKMHGKGASLEQIYKWATEKFGDVDTSFAFRGFVQSLRKDAKGKIVVASKDLKFLNSIGIRNASFEGKEKCASCEYHKKALSPMLDYPETEMESDIKPCVNCDADQSHFSYDEHGEVFCTSCGEVQPISVQDLNAYQMSGKTSSKAGRVEQKFASKTVDVVRSKQAEAKEVVVTSAKVRTLHQAGHSVEKIYKGAASKVGSVQARKAVASFVEDMKKRPGKVAVSESDRAFLVGKLGFKPEQVRMLDPQRRPVTQVVASVPDDQHLIAYPGMEKHAGEKKAVDGYAILNEFDLMGGHDMQDIDTSGPKRDEVEMNDTFKVDLE